jgi:hypothetical protein
MPMQRGGAIFPFGRYKGVDIEDIPDSYLKWSIDVLDEKKYNNKNIISECERELAYRKLHNITVDEEGNLEDEDEEESYKPLDFRDSRSR